MFVSPWRFVHLSSTIHKGVFRLLLFEQTVEKHDTTSSNNQSFHLTISLGTPTYIVDQRIPKALLCCVGGGVMSVVAILISACRPAQLSRQ